MYIFSLKNQCKLKFTYIYVNLVSAPRFLCDKRSLPSESQVIRTTTIETTRKAWRCILIAQFVSLVTEVSTVLEVQVSQFLKWVTYNM